jgi:hypothetical protein
MPGKSLSAEKIATTTETLASRVAERFPGSGLEAISRDLVELAAAARATAPAIARPIYPVRVGVALLIAAVILLVGSLLRAGVERMEQVGGANVTDLVSALEAGTNEVVLIGLGIFFLVSLETRIKRRRAIRAIHEMRSIAHVIDMHQLTKDPATYRKYPGATKSSPLRQLTLFQLIRYLDYCSEMLSMTSKIAALYIQRFNDAAVLAAVSDVETLCMSLSAKIWQKLQIAESILEEAGRELPASA